QYRSNRPLCESYGLSFRCCYAVQSWPPVRCWSAGRFGPAAVSITPAAIATDSHGFVYVAGNTTASDFPVTNALETQPPQGALEVSSNGAPFVNAGIGLSPTANYSGVTAVGASSDGTLVIVATASSTYRSTDGGVTWKPTADTSAAGAAALAVDPVNSSNAYALGTSGVFHRSSNGGLNWQAIGGPPNTVPIGLPNPYQPPPSGVAS